jgi:hypothetical protein
MGLGRFRLIRYVLAAVLFAIPALAEQALPSLAPSVKSVFPHGIRKGTAAEVVLKGEHLEGTHTVHFAGSGVQATVLSATRSRARVRVTAGPDAEVGTRDFRLVTPRGSYVGVFDIGSLDETREAEPNDDPRKPQRITLPCTVNGVIENEDWDHFAFHAAGGETLAFEVMATRNGSRLDADLAILDAQGRELAWNDDHYIFGDPRVEYRFPKDGDYVVRVGSLAGGPMADYRLIAGRVPYLSHTLPAGVERGKPSEITIYGSFLENVTEVWLGSFRVPGKILSRTAASLRVSVRVPPTTTLGEQHLHVASGGLEAPVPAAVLIGEIEEITVTGNPATPTEAIPIRTPAVVNGAISRPDQSQYFSFHAEAGQRFEFRVDSMHLGYSLDPVITLFDPSGKRLAAADDPGIDERTDEYQLDPRMAYQFPQTGTYLVAVRDSMYRGSPDFVYRLSVLPDATDFRLEAREPVKTVYAGEQTELLLRVRRLGGWDTPVEVEAVNLPPGIVSEKVIVPAKDSVVKDTCGVERTIDGTIVHLPLRVEGTQPGLYHISIRAQGQRGGQRVEHVARVDYERYAAGYFYGPMQEQQMDLSVVAAPRVFLTTPEKIEVAPGGSAPLQITVARFREAAGRALIIRATSLPPGIRLEPVSVPAEAKQFTMQVAAAPDAREGEAAVTLSAEIAGAAPPVEPSSVRVQIRRKPEPGGTESR